MKAIRTVPGRLVLALLLTVAAQLSPPGAGTLAGQAQEVTERVPDIILFTHVTCPYCQDAKRWVEDLQRRDPGLTIWVRELSEDLRAGAELEEIGRMAGVRSPGVPAWVIGGQVFFVGFGGAATTGRQVEQLLAQLGLPAAPAVAEADPATPPADQPAARPGEPEATPAPPPAPRQAMPTSEPVPAPEPAPEMAPEATPEPLLGGEEAAGEIVGGEGEADTLAAVGEARPLQVAAPDQGTLSLPFFGDVDAASMSLPVLTGLIAFVDGFNPCSLWVLTFLLGVVLYSGSRRRVLLVGGLFLLVTASAYGLFIVGMFGTLRYIAYVGWITLVVAGMALIFALVNIKDYFWFQKGVSFTISDRHKPKFFERTRNLMHPGRSTPALLVGTVVLALGITLVELPCTAGFPMVWTGIIATQAVPFAYFAALLALYLSVYLMIELVIFGSVVVTMKRSRFEEKHGRILKLFGGMIMLALALTLVVAPDTMHSLAGTLAVFGGAIVASALVLWLHRRVLPRYGIVIGSEELGAGPAVVGAPGPQGPEA